MNDPSEGRQSGGVVSACWTKAVANENRNSVLDVSYLHSIAEEVKRDGRSGDFPKVFLFSLTKLKDSLSQWSRYGEDGRGFALGFRIDPTQFKKFTPGREWGNGPFLYEVLYTSALSDGETQAFGLGLVALMQDFLARTTNAKDVMNGMLLAADLLKPLFKHTSYSEESEWRIVAYTVERAVSLYDLRRSRFGLVPFMPVKLGPGIRLEEIMLGPQVSVENEWAVAWLCRKYRIDAKVSRSGLSYR